MKTGLNATLDPTRRSNEALDFETALRRKIVGQEAAVEKVAEIYQMFLAGLNAPGRPVGNLLFLGPTGSGKTRVVEAMAESLFGDPHACIKIDCAEFQHSHEIAKLVGSPPGYLGHRETHPLLTQEALNQWHTEKLKLSILLFDEIEKASDSLWQLLLGILDKATLTLGDNRRVDLSQCVIVMTSNLGAAEMNEMINGTHGFRPDAGADGRQARRKDRSHGGGSGAPQVLARVHEPYRQGGRVPYAARASTWNRFWRSSWDWCSSAFSRPRATTSSCSAAPPPVKQFLLQEGTDLRYGARHLKRAIERNIVFPLANLVATGQVKLGDFIRIDRDSGGKMTFVKEAEGALVPVLLERYGPEASAQVAAAGKGSKVAASGRGREVGTAPSLDRK